MERGLQSHPYLMTFGFLRILAVVNPHFLDLATPLFIILVRIDFFIFIGIFSAAF